MAGPNVTEKCSNGRCEIPAGSFQMGSTEGDPDEQPVRTVAMTGFQLGQMEVSVDDYQAYLVGTAGVQLSAVIAGCGTSGTSRTIAAHKGETKGQLRERAAQMVVGESCNVMQVVESTPSGMPDFPENKKGGNYPVVALTMDEKRAYCQAQGGDLPTAAQLHYASRFDDQDSATGDLVISDHVFRSDDGFRSAEPVNGGYKDRFGVYNLFGNVWESTLDAYDKDFYARMASQNPYNPLTNPWSPLNRNGQLEEFSGGSFNLIDWYARSANRGNDSPDNHHRNVGFRCAWPLP